MPRWRLIRLNRIAQIKRHDAVRWHSSEPSSSTPRAERPTKITTLPFHLLSRSKVKSLARKTSLEVYGVLDGGSIFARAINWILLPFGLAYRPTRSQTDGNQSTTKVLSIRAVYVPFWATDAAATLKVKSEMGNANARIILNRARFPANDDGLFRTLPFDIPDPEKNRYCPFDVEKHLKENVSNGPKPEVLPFVISPLLFPVAFLKSGILKNRFPVLDASHVVDQDSTTNAMMSIQSGQAQKLTKQTLQFDINTLQIDYLSANPILLPFYLVHSVNKKEGMDPQKAMIAIPGWESNQHYYAFSIQSVKEQNEGKDKKQKDKKETFYSEWKLTHLTSTTTLSFFFNPRSPLPSSLEEQGKKIRDQETKGLEGIEEDVAKEVKENQQDGYEHWEVNNDTHRERRRAIKQEAVDRLTEISVIEQKREFVIAWYIMRLLRDRAYELLVDRNQVPWDNLRRLTRTEFGTFKEGEISSTAPEAKAGLGLYIPWNSEQVVSFCSDQHKEYQKYIKDLFEFQVSRNRVITKERTLDEDSYFLYSKGETAFDLINKKKAELIKNSPKWLLKYIQTERIRLKKAMNDETIEDWVDPKVAEEKDLIKLRREKVMEKLAKMGQGQTLSGTGEEEEVDPGNRSNILKQRDATTTQNQTKKETLK